MLQSKVEKSNVWNGKGLLGQTHGACDSLSQQEFCGEHLNRVPQPVLSTVNFVCSCGLNYQQFPECSSVAAEYPDMVCHTAAQWCSRGKVLFQFLSLGPRLNFF